MIATCCQLYDLDTWRGIGLARASGLMADGFSRRKIDGLGQHELALIAFAIH